MGQQQTGPENVSGVSGVDESRAFLEQRSFNHLLERGGNVRLKARASAHIKEKNPRVTVRSQTIWIAHLLDSRLLKTQTV